MSEKADTAQGDGMLLPGPEYAYQVVGRSGRVYEVPREVFDLIDAAHKRVIRRANDSG